MTKNNTHAARCGKGSDKLRLASLTQREVRAKAVLQAKPNNAVFNEMLRNPDGQLNMSTATPPKSTPIQPIKLNDVPKNSTPKNAATDASLFANPAPIAKFFCLNSTTISAVATICITEAAKI